jgi:hypothetical protein
MTVSESPRREPSRDNHYVPEWYQRGFHVNGTDAWFLDISPPCLRPDGTPILVAPRPRPPKACFWEKDLYVTSIGEQFNDQVETVLFQDIDDFGAVAVRAFAGVDPVAHHEEYPAMLAYLGAQTLRTPKGLDWIRSRYPALSQIELLVEMQHLRHMFGTLWAESVHEIVSAENASVKFLLTDHPVTTFNAALPFDALPLVYPEDAPVTWNGTQTLFALDQNHLLILTHVPYAKNSSAVDPTAKRTNARFFRNTLMRTDALLRGRRLDSDGVTAINAWLKARAKRYIAAGKPEWLYPEREQPVDRTRLAQLLRPPQKDLWRFGGEIHIGYKDGTFGYRDAYGRTSREHEFVVKPLPATPPALGDPCPCGRGDTFARCCEHLPAWQRPPWDVWSVRERNEGFLRAVYGVLEIKDESAWDRIQRRLSDGQVAQLHRISQSLWPPDTDLTALLPRPGDGRLRAVYMGPSDVRSAGKSFISMVPLFDQIWVMDPFMAARNLRPEYSPITTPGPHKQQLLKNVMFWLMLEPLIRAGKVVVFPDPGDISPEFQHAMGEMAQERTANWHPKPQDYVEFRGLAEEDTKRSLLQLPDDVLRSIFKRATPDKSDAFIQQVIDHMRREAERDPLALLQVLPDATLLNQTFALRSVNLEVAVFIAQSLGAIIVTNVHALWEHLHLHTRAAAAIGEAPSTDVGMRMKGAMNPLDSLEVAASPAAEEARSALRNMLAAAGDRQDTATALTTLGSRLAALMEEGRALHNPNATLTMTVTASMPASGFETPTAQRLVVGFGRGEPPVFLGLALFCKPDFDDVSETEEDDD